jgi:hypothetical protein
MSSQNPFLLGLPNTTNAFSEYYQHKRPIKLHINTDQREVPVVESVGDTLISYFKRELAVEKKRKSGDGGGSSSSSSSSMRSSSSSNISTANTVAGGGDKARRLNP